MEEYSSRDLHGLKVEHGGDAFREGKDIILTLKDTGTYVHVRYVFTHIRTYSPGYSTYITSDSRGEMNLIF